MEIFVFPGDSLVRPDGSYDAYYVGETWSLCTKYKYHTHKIILYLSAMRQFASSLEESGETVYYDKLDPETQLSYEEKLSRFLTEHDVESVTTYRMKDHGFTAVQDACETTNTSLSYLDNPTFLTNKEQMRSYAEDNKWHHATFYKWQRRRLDILVEDGAPVNGQWSFDEDNRESFDAIENIPDLPSVEHGETVGDVQELVASSFPDHPGDADTFWLPTTKDGARAWLQSFLDERFDDFGTYQDAMSAEVDTGYHSVLSPLLNTGLLEPETVVDEAVRHYENNGTRYASVEGFIRQVIGWREFMRGVYDNVDLKQNVFNHDRGLSQDWWDASTGLKPVDAVIDQANRIGYAHHIQRLMLASNAMLLCEVDPDKVYDWFMSLYIDSADWVMEPNVYDMGQFATGGVFATKPYISSSNYVRKMSDYSNGEWCDEWDALYWSFLHRHRDALSDNHRMSFMLSLLDKKGDDELERINERAGEVRERLTVELD